MTSWTLDRSDPHPEPLRTAQDVDGDGAVDLFGVERPQEFGDARHRLAVEADDDVAGQKTRMRGRSRLIDAEEPRPSRLFELEPQRDPARDRRRRGPDADIGAPHPAVSRDLARDEIGGVGGDGKADALRAHDDGRVDADDLASR